MRGHETPAAIDLRHLEHKVAFIAFNKVPAVRPELVLDRFDKARGSIDTDGLLSPEKQPQQLVETGEVVHMPVRDKDAADAQELARSKPAEIANVEKQRAPLEYEIQVKTGIAEGIVD